MASNEILAQRLSSFIDGTGKSEAAVARKIGIDGRAFNNYVKGREPKDKRLLDKIAAYFETSRAYLLGYTHDPSPSPSSPISTKHVQKPLTPAPQNGGRHPKEESMVDTDLLMKSIMQIQSEMISLRQDVRSLSDRMAAMESRAHPQKGRKAR